MSGSEIANRKGRELSGVLDGHYVLSRGATACMYAWQVPVPGVRTSTRPAPPTSPPPRPHGRRCPRRRRRRRCRRHLTSMSSTTTTRREAASCERTRRADIAATSSSVRPRRTTTASSTSSSSSIRAATTTSGLGDLPSASTVSALSGVSPCRRDASVSKCALKNTRPNTILIIVLVTRKRLCK